MIRTIKLDDGKTSFKMHDTVLEQCMFVIEHQSRGLFREFDLAENSGKWGPRFLRADRINRRSPEVWSTRSSDEALRMIVRVIEHVPNAYLVKMLRTQRGAR